MLSLLFERLSQAVLIFFRTFKAFFTRRIAGLVARFRQLTNLTRGARKLATTSIESAATVTQKPTKREDYIEAGALLVSKAFLIKLIIGLVVALLLIYFLIWPFILSHFLTAKFYVEDSKIENWTGRVIVYSDKKKTIPLYSGRLEDGKLEGEGKEYDEDGILSYEGTFVEGQRSGMGTAYEHGLKTYKGEFLAGVASGEGTSYDVDGNVTYQGEFSEGIQEGTGKAYKKGDLIYEGEFSGGLYNGEGTAYLSSTETVKATFKDGLPDGDVTWSKDGKAYYKGEWSDGRPEGYGALYSKSGKTLYEGQFYCGTLDGTWLLSLTLDELKEALGEVQTTSTRENAQTFLLSSSELGLVARCSYQTDESESQVNSIYLFRPKGETWLKLLPGQDNVKLMAKDYVTNVMNGSLQFNAPKGVDVPSGVYNSRMLFTSDTRTTFLRTAASNDPALLTWSRWDSGSANGSGFGGSGGSGGSDPGGGSGGSSAGGGSSEKAMEDFLDSLDGMDGAGGVGSVPNDYCGDKSASDALNACTEPKQLYTVVNAMAEYWLQSETQAGLEENLSRVETQLQEAKSNNSMGGNTDTSELEKEKASLEGQIKSCENKRAKAQVEAKDAAGVDPAEYSAGDILVQFDPTSLDTSSLVSTAAAYAKSIGEEADSDNLQSQIKDLLVDLKEAYNQLQSSVESCRLVSDNATTATNNYAMGESNKSTWFSALSSEVDAEREVYSDAVVFTKYANELNTLTGGWVSRNCNWFKQEMTYIFESVMKQVTSEEDETSSTESSKNKASSAETSKGGAASTETSKGETSPTDTSSAGTSKEETSSDESSKAEAASTGSSEKENASAETSEEKTSETDTSAG